MYEECIASPQNKYELAFINKSALHLSFLTDEWVGSTIYVVNSNALDWPFSVFKISYSLPLALAVLEALMHAMIVPSSLKIAVPSLEMKSRAKLIGDCHKIVDLLSCNQEFAISVSSQLSTKWLLVNHLVISLLPSNFEISPKLKGYCHPILRFLQNWKTIAGCPTIRISPYSHTSTSKYII